MKINLVKFFDYSTQYSMYISEVDGSFRRFCSFRRRVFPSLVLLATTVEVVAATAAQVVFPEGDSKGESPLGLQLVGSDLRTHTIISEWESNHIPNISKIIISVNFEAVQVFGEEKARWIRVGKGSLETVWWSIKLLEFLWWIIKLCPWYKIFQSLLFRIKILNPWQT